ncbi:hypothetical protein Q0N12_10385 [Rossellomorea marisflavi]|uniref:hypothetical protein n=1 Tax=Rossellomorea marisflavi TaxID=189381 RepID=UPI003457C8C2
MITIKTASIVLHVLFSLSILFQLGAVLTISSTFDDLNVPIHFSIDGTADSFGTINDYLLLIGINILVYALSVTGATFVRKTNPQQFDFFHTEAEKQKAAVKIKIFAQVLAVHFSIFVTWLLAGALRHAWNPGSDFHLETSHILVFIGLTALILFLGFLWIFKTRQPTA